MDDLIKRIQRLEDKIDKRVYQEDIVPDAVKSRHIGEGVRFIRSGLEAALPDPEEPQQGAPFYFATDTNKLYAHNGTAWVSTTLS